MKKNRGNKNFFVSKLLLACFFVMLVFSVFNINKVLANIDNIAITNAVIEEKSSTTDATITSFTRDKLVTKVTYHKINDYVTFKITLKNNDSKNYTIKTITDNNSDTHILYEYDKHENEEFKSNTEKELIIKSTYKNEVTNVNSRTINDNVEFKITFVDESGEESETIIPINPQTVDDLMNYIVIGILSAVGLLVTLKNKKLKKSLFIVLLMVPFIVRAASLSYEFDFTSEIKYFDKIVVNVDRNGTNEQIIVPYGEKISAPTVVNIPGYNFIGYYNGEVEFNFNSAITEDIEIEAKYEAITYHISYDLDDGVVAVANPLTYTVEDEFTLNNPSKQGFEFEGWTGTGLSGLTTSVTINKGTINDLSYVAHFVEGTSTPYKVVHKYQNYDLTTYTEEEQPLTGVTNSIVYPQIRHKDGFKDPDVTSLKIKPDGSAKLEYIYQRESYNYSFNQNVISTLEAGSYLYETEITVSPKVLPGYTFSKWEDDSTENPRTIILSDTINVVPTYIPNDDTAYTVHHKYQTLNNTYETVDVTEHGITDQVVEAPRSPRTGFKTPSIQTVKILGTGLAEVTYTYDRETYEFTVGENITSTLPAGTYMYGQEITLTAEEVEGYTFAKWEDESTINPRTITITNNIDVSATYYANLNTPYTVHHKYQTLNNTYEVENVTEHGETGTTVEAPRSPRTGFKTPSIQTVKILGTGLAEVTYTYDRETYEFNVTDRTYLTAGSTANGTYMYGQEISVTASERAGYAFNWDDNDTAYTKTFILTGAVTLEPIYTANQNTAYTVKHYKQQLDGTYLSEPDETDDLTGTTDTNVTPATRSYTGFTAPSVQTDSISGDGSTVFNYYYTRDKHNLTLTNTDYIQEGDISGEYYYGEQITLTATGKQGHTFTGWTGGANTTSITITMGVEDITIGPEYSINSYTYTVGENITSSLPSGTYQYGTSITVSANEIPGYTFTEWEDGTTTSARVIVLSDNTSISATYTANTDTVYTVHHRYQTLNNTYEVEDVTEHGTTDTTVEAPLSPRTGFVNPEVQQVKILGTGLAEVTYTYNRKTYTFEIGDHVTSTLEPGTYMHGTTITVTADTRPGYTFEEWEDETLTSTRVIVLTSNVTAVPAYTANTNTAYVVKHYKQQLDGTYSSEPDETDDLTGTTESSVTPSTKSYTGFTAPSTQTKQISGDGTTVFSYYYTRDKHELILENDEDIVEGDISGEYYYGQSITLTAKTKAGHTFSKWSNAETENPITITMGTTDITIGPEYTINSYTIIFDTQGGTPQPSARVITYNNPIGGLPDNVTKEGFTFAGWYDAPDGGTLITASTLVTGNDTYYAHWDEIIIPGIICKKAVSLNTEICDASKTGQGCRASGTGYNLGDTITYGSIVRSDTIQVGDAFDCDVDGTGYNKRFYYLRTVDNKAALIYNKSVAESIYGSDDPASYLPTASTWSNLPVSFDDNGVTRFPSVEDLCAATGLACPDNSTTNISATGAFDSINFIFENTGYAISTGKSTVWVTKNGELTGRYHKNARNYNEPDSTNGSYNSVRPVIEIPLASIEDDYIVKYDPVNGSLSNQYVRVAKGDSLGTLPTPTQSGWEFLGWFDSNQFTNPITASYMPVGYETYYAKYVKSVGSSPLTYDSFELEVNDTDTIAFNNQADVEPRTYASSDDVIVTVDASGNITALAPGTATITITGSISNTTKTVTVTVIVASPYYYITFDVDGGESLAGLPVTKNTAAGSLPTTTRTNYTFAGWFTNTDFTTEVTGETIITKNMTVHAKWIPNDAVAEVNNNTFYTTLQDAIDAAPTTKSTVKLLKNVEVTTPIDMINKNTDKDIILDLNGYTLSTANSAVNKTNVIKTKAKLEVKNGTISSSKNDALIDVEGNNSYLVLRENINLVSTGGRACVYNTGGNALIDGNATLTSNAEWTSSMKRGTVQTLNSGTTTIKGGTIINNRASSSYAVAIQLGTVTIGTKDGIYDIDNLVIQGETNGIYADVDYSLYDGLVKGKTAAVNNENNITSEEDNMTRVNDEVGGYKRLYYQAAVSKIKITLNSNGGSGTPDFITVDEGDPVAESDITTPTKGVYTFTGWYYDAELQNSVTFPFTPTASIPLYAGWSYVVDPTPVAFNMTNDVMEEYFTNINTWKTQYTVTQSTKSDESGYTEVLNTTEFDTTMRTNFDAHNCSTCGTSASQNNCSSPLDGDYCERPKGYDTGLGEAVDVYEYDSSTDTSTLITYTTSDTGVIYNMIPGKVYKWASTSDSNIYGYVAPIATSGRRTIYSTARNIRDLGGMEVSFTRGNTTKTGTIKYGKLYRGAQLSGGQTDVNSLTKLGITREVDLRDQNEGTNPVRLPKHDKCDGNCGTLSSAEDIIITNYRIYPTYGNGDNYAALRDAMKYVMQSVVDGDNIYFHCTIGTDRTGTLAYFLEGLLGVSEEDKLEDYELTYFYGLLNRTRFHDNLSGSNINPRFLSMYKTYDTNEKIYNFYMYGLTEEQIAEENVLIEQFRDAMIDYN